MKKREEKIIVEAKEEELEEKAEKNVTKEKKNINVPEYYTLKIGETLNDVAKKFELSEETLKKLNGEVFGTNQIKLK
jgi:LysM repeat protein